jgi:hypothetical protein
MENVRRRIDTLLVQSAAAASTDDQRKRRTLIGLDRSLAELQYIDQIFFILLLLSSSSLVKTLLFSLSNPYMRVLYYSLLFFL